MAGLRDVLSAFVIEACSLVVEPFPSQSWAHIDRGSGVVTESRVDYSVPYIVANKLRELASARAVLSVVRADENLRSLFLVDGLGRPFSDELEGLRHNLLHPVFKSYLARAKGSHVDSRIVCALVSDVEAEISSGSETHIIVPLGNVELRADPVQFGSLTLREISDGERDTLYNTYSPFASGPSFFEWTEVNCCVEKTFHVTAKQTFSFGPSSDIGELDLLIDAVRLVTDKNCWPMLLYSYSDSVFATIKSIAGSGAAKGLPGPPAVIDDGNRVQLRDVWRRLVDGPNSDTLALAVARWGSALQKNRGEDKIVDYWIGLESLFASDSNQEVTYRASLRVAAFVGETPEERISLLDSVKDSYGVRSNVVHGYRPEGKKAEKKWHDRLWSNVDATRSFLRKSILRIAERKDAFKCTKIEEDLLRL